MPRLRKLTVCLTQDRVAGLMVELVGLFTTCLTKQWSADCTMPLLASGAPIGDRIARLLFSAVPPRCSW